MKVFFLFAPAFLEWPLALAREFQSRFDGSSFAGLATGFRSTADRVNQADVRVEPLDYLDDLEREWLATESTAEDVSYFEGLFGAEAIRRLIIADRQIGRGYVSGGEIAQTGLMTAVEDPQLLQNYVIGILKYALNRLQKQQPDIVVCHVVAGAQAFALALVCEHLGILFARLNHTRVGKRWVLENSPLDRLNAVRDRLKDPLYSPEVMAQAKDYIGNFRQRVSAPEYLAAHKSRERHRQSVSFLTKAAIAAARTQLLVALGRRELPIRRPLPAVQFQHLLKVALRSRKLRKSPLFHQPGERPPQPFVFYPLHVDPEAATMVLSHMHTDQLAVVEALSKGLPLGMRLVVKEHEPSLGQRPPGYYERLARLPGVFLASPSDSGAALVREAALTATITGTAAWEAMILKKPALIIGSPPYSMVGEGFVQCSELTSMPTAISAALEVKPASDESLTRYVAAILDVSFETETDVIWGKVTSQTVQNNPTFLKAVMERLLAMSDQSQFRRRKETAALAESGASSEVAEAASCET